MTVLWQFWRVIGWKGVAGVGFGALIAAVPAYQAGIFVESSRTSLKISEAKAEWTLQQKEANDARIDAAIAARLHSDRAGRDGLDGGRLPDDGYRRD